MKPLHAAPVCLCPLLSPARIFLSISANLTNRPPLPEAWGRGRRCPAHGSAALKLLIPYGTQARGGRVAFKSPAFLAIRLQKGCGEAALFGLPSRGRFRSSSEGTLKGGALPAKQQLYNRIPVLFTFTCFICRCQFEGSHSTVQGVVQGQDLARRQSGMLG